MKKITYVIRDIIKGLAIAAAIIGGIGLVVWLVSLYNETYAAILLIGVITLGLGLLRSLPRLLLFGAVKPKRKDDYSSNSRYKRVPSEQNADMQPVRKKKKQPIENREISVAIAEDLVFDELFR